MNPAQQCELAMAIADSPPSVQEEIARLRDALAAQWGGRVSSFDLAQLRDELAARDALIQELEQTSKRFQARRMADIQARERAEFSASQWQQRAELAERQRDELVELMGDQLACPECGGDSIVSELQADGGGAAHYEPCTRCGGLGGIGMRRPVRARCPHCGGTGKEPA